ncbi:molybdenum cofactor guanylyltransferase [Streptomyces sp. NPDC003077]|uniref:molybdenum cofactor guanylyltransferase n=1 Tax=Streptomyces sp. NPDC003077 TaxID=3154443 RepID=UPI0033A1E9E5
MLAGGRARRLGGADKPLVPVGGRTLLDHAVLACSGARTTVVVGPPRPTLRPVRHVREEPVHGGPLAALAAGMRAVDTPLVVVLAADLPFVRREAVEQLPAQVVESGADGVVMWETQGRDNPLFAAYRADALRRGIASLTERYGALTGLPIRSLTGGLALRYVPDVHGVSFDCDTWEAVALARACLAAGRRCEGPGPNGSRAELWAAVPDG